MDREADQFALILAQTRTMDSAKTLDLVLEHELHFNCVHWAQTVMTVDQEKIKFPAVLLAEYVEQCAMLRRVRFQCQPANAKAQRECAAQPLLDVEGIIRFAYNPSLVIYELFTTNHALSILLVFMYLYSSIKW